MKIRGWIFIIKGVTDTRHKQFQENIIMKKSSLLSAATFGVLLAAQSISAETTKQTEPTAKQPEAVMGECHGINACKGKSLCGSEGGNECAGKNTCKGKGWLSMTKKDCLSKKGKWAAMNGMHHK
jgi:hypothetical protein